ncbi:MAG: metallophosphoesterase family protein [Paludibacteraceae bacterium]|nr:metallophosphoesterase family protein [Paludibacteraceae bacterium]
MRKIYFLLFAGCLSLSVYATPLDLDPATVLADTMYEAADYTVPSYTEFLVAKNAAVKSATQANLQALVDAVAGLQAKEQPYNMVATINGDPKTHMGFCWFTNEGINDGVVQILPMANATAEDFETIDGLITVEATPTTTKVLRYTGKCTYAVSATGIKASVRYKYVSHKALAENLTPGTTYSWRVGYAGHWSEIAQFQTEEEEQGEYSFLIMSDSHIMNKTYVDEARRCALAAVKTAPDAKFCCFPGDFVEDGDANNSEWEWERWFEESMKPVIMHMPMVPTDGNHDDSPNINYTYHFNTDNYFNTDITNKPQFQGITYSFVYGDVLFLVFSMQDFWRESYDQLYRSWSVYLTDHVSYWFRRQCHENPDTHFRVSLAHFNLFSGSDHSTDNEPPLFRRCMLPTMKECEIDVALQGHDHTYEVIGPVNPDSLTPILSAISDREIVEGGTNKNMTGYKNGTYRTDDGTFYFIGATCGHKRYYPHTRQRMESEYTEDESILYDDKHHNVKNYFDLFTGMFGQPEAPTFTVITVKEDCLEFKSYTADDDDLNVTLINTMRIVRTKEHTVTSVREGIEAPEAVKEGTKFMRDGQLLILRDGRTFNALGQEVK